MAAGCIKQIHVTLLPQLTWQDAVYSAVETELSLLLRIQPETKMVIMLLVNTHTNIHKRERERKKRNHWIPTNSCISLTHTHTFIPLSKLKTCQTRPWPESLASSTVIKWQRQELVSSSVCHSVLGEDFISVNSKVEFLVAESMVYTLIRWGKFCCTWLMFSEMTKQGHFLVIK